jgi:Amt family ammonium transporter
MYVLGIKLFIIMKIDDPLEAGVVHGFCGVWGIIAAGLFNHSTGFLMANISEDKISLGQRSKLFSFQCIGCLAIIAWTASFSYIFFYIFKKYDLLRTPLLDEIVGLDIAELGDPLPDF